MGVREMLEQVRLALTTMAPNRRGIQVLLVRTDGSEQPLRSVGMRGGREPAILLRETYE